MKNDKKINIKEFIKNENEKKIMESKKSDFIKKLLDNFAIHMK